jgi:hypothetical protein
MRLNRADTEKKRIGDLAVRLTGNQQPEDLHFSR